MGIKMSRGTSRIISCSWVLLLATAISLSSVASVRANNTAVLFGATGAVGNEVLRTILEAKSGDNEDPFFTKLVLVGRRAFPPKVEDLLPSSPTDLPEIVRVEIPNLEEADQHEELAEQIAGDGSSVACFLAVGAGHPNQYDFHSFHSIEVTMNGSMAKLCGKMGSTSVTLLSAIDPDIKAEPYSAEELVPTGEPMGWWPVVAEMMRIMGLKEQAVISNARLAATTTTTSSPAHVRIFNPSNIITEEIRYGWLDWTLFKIHAVIDPVLPTKYHSVTTKLLASAMVKDAMNVLTGSAHVDEDDGATRFTYGDFLRITGEGSGTSTEL